MGGKASKPFVLYGFPISQPTRSVMLLCSVADIPYEFKHIDLVKGEHKTEEFAKINPTQLVPCITDPDYDLTLAEGAAILVHIAETRNIQDLYPSDAAMRAKINFWLHWNHSNTRKLTMKVLIPKMFLKDDAAFKAGLEEVKPSLDFLEKYLADSGTKFLLGDKPTIADLMIAPELDQMPKLGLLEYTDYPAITKFLEPLGELKGYEQNLKDALASIGM